MSYCTVLRDGLLAAQTALANATAAENLILVELSVRVGLIDFSASGAAETEGNSTSAEPLARVDLQYLCLSKTAELPDSFNLAAPFDRVALFDF